MWNVLLLSVFIVCRSIHASTVTVQLEHRLGSDVFESAGILKGNISPEGALIGPFTLQRKPLSESQETKLKDLARQNGQYSLRIKSSLTGQGSDYVMTSIPARCLLTSSFSESLSLDLTDDNRIISMDYRSNCHTMIDSVNYEDFSLFESELIEVALRYPRSAARLSMQDMIRRAESEEAPMEGAKPGTPAKNQKTWLQQNWLFIIAGAVIMFQILGAVADPNAGQPNQAQARR